VEARHASRGRELEQSQKCKGFHVKIIRSFDDLLEKGMDVHDLPVLPRPGWKTVSRQPPRSFVRAWGAFLGAESARREAYFAGL